MSPTGHLQWLAPGLARRVEAGGQRALQVTLPAPVAAAGVVVERPPGAPVTVGVPTAVTAETGPVTLDGPMQAGVTAPHWAFTGTFGAFGVFPTGPPGDGRGWRARAAAPLRPAPGSGRSGRTPAGARRSPCTTAPRWSLTRSESWSSGWQATVRPVAPTGAPGPAGPPEHPPVTRHGVVQQVAVPGPGDFEVSFSYRPASVRAGMVVSAVAAGVLVGWGAAEIAARRRRRRRARRPPGVDPGGAGPDQSGRSRPMAPAARR